MKKNNFINKWLDENQDPKIEAKVKAEATVPVAVHIPRS